MLALVAVTAASAAWSKCHVPGLSAVGTPFSGWWAPALRTSIILFLHFLLVSAFIGDSRLNQRLPRCLSNGDSVSPVTPSVWVSWLPVYNVYHSVSLLPLVSVWTPKSSSCAMGLFPFMLVIFADAAVVLDLTGRAPRPGPCVLWTFLCHHGHCVKAALFVAALDFLVSTRSDGPDWAHSSWLCLSPCPPPPPLPPLS